MSEEESSQEFDHVTGWVKYFALISTRLMYWVGLLPFTAPELSFKLASARTFFSFVRLLIFTSPLLILPPIFLLGGPCQKEYEEATGLDWNEAVGVSGKVFLVPGNGKGNWKSHSRFTGRERELENATGREGIIEARNPGNPGKFRLVKFEACIPGNPGKSRESYKKQG